MNLVSMMDELLRNRLALYQQAREGTRVGSLCLRLLALFLLSAAIYGAVMGAYRTLHPDFFFSDFALTTTGGVIQGDVAGLTVEQNAIYTRVKLAPADMEGATIRFNVTNPSDAYTIAAISEEKGFTKIALAPGTPLREVGGWVQPMIVALKIPLMFLLTLAVCSLALYILNLAIGLNLHFKSTITLMLFALAGTGVLLVVFAPISLLFSVVTANYHFMKILHVLVFGVAGIFGVKILGEGLRFMSAPSPEELTTQPFAPGNQGKVRLVLFSWLLLYCLVGAQMAWTLKPFLGTPYLPATPPFRMERGNIFVSTLESMHGVGSGGGDERAGR